MWALSKMLHCGPWPYGYKSCISTICCLFDHIEFWDIPLSPITPYVYACVRNRKSITDFLQIFLIMSFNVTVCWNGDQFTVGLQIVLVESVENVVWCQKKDREREVPLNWATGSLQFFLEDRLSMVTAHIRIASRCRVNCKFQRESEFSSIYSLLSR